MAAVTRPMSIRDFGPFGSKVHDEAHNKDLDAKILCTSHNSRPGLGKTTWAIKFARALDPNGWSAEDKAFMDPYNYMNAYDDVEPGSVLLLDEIGVAGDSRRSMSDKNVSLIQMWETKRYRNIITIGTLPTTSVLDKKLIELSDYRVNVVRRGVAKVFEIKIPDFPPHRPWQEPMDGVIDFSDLPEGDDDKEYLDELKIQETSVEKEYFTEREVQKKIKKVREETEREYRNKLLRKVYSETDLSQTDLSNIADLSQPQVNKILNQ